MEKNKFEFQKLELPQQVLNKETVQEIPDNPIYHEHSVPQKQGSPKTIGYYALTAIIFAATGYQLHKYFIVEESNKSRPISIQKDTVVAKKTLIKASKDTTRPVYINYYDSIVFLNKVKGTKIVVSKGFDEYLKKNRLIVKVDDNYYNLYCDDLISNYSVGDSIP